MTLFKYSQFLLLFMTVFLLALSTSIASAQKTEYMQYTVTPNPTIKTLVTGALKKKIDSFYEEFQYVPYIQYSTFDLNGDGKREILARFAESYAFRDKYNNIDTHIFAHTSKGLIQILEMQAFDVALGKIDDSGLREIIAFKNKNKSRYEIYKWDGKRRYIKK